MANVLGYLPARVLQILFSKMYSGGVSKQVPALFGQPVVVDQQEIALPRDAGRDVTLSGVAGSDADRSFRGGALVGSAVVAALNLLFVALIVLLVASVTAVPAALGALGTVGVLGLGLALNSLLAAVRNLHEEKPSDWSDRSGPQLALSIVAEGLVGLSLVMVTAAGLTAFLKL